MWAVGSARGNSLTSVITSVTVLSAHWGGDRMALILQVTFSKTFSCMNFLHLTLCDLQDAGLIPLDREYIYIYI